MPLRPVPSYVHRPVEPDAVTLRQHWRALAADAVVMGGWGGVANPGEAWMEPDGFRHQLARGLRFPADRGDALAAGVEAAFRAVAKAMLDAGTPERRAVVAPLLAEAGRTVDRLLMLVIEPQLALSRRISGDNEED